MVANAAISNHHIRFFILNNNINKQIITHITSGIQFCNPNPIPRRAKTIPVIAPVKCILFTIFSVDLNHVATPTNDRPVPDKKKNTLSWCNVIVIPRDKQKIENKILNGYPN